MSDESAFLGTLRDAPHNDTVRMIFADWLEENEQSHRAELVRLQIRLSNWIPEITEREEVLSRVTELINHHRLRWLGPLAEDPNLHCRFRRGLIDVTTSSVPRATRHDGIGILRIVVPPNVEPITPEMIPECWLVQSQGVILQGRLLCGIDPAPPESIRNSLGVNLVPIPAGEFRMGSPESEHGHDGDEHLHTVRISRPFLMSDSPVTQEVFERVMSFNPSRFDLGGAFVQMPVESVSWTEADRFCRLLSDLPDEQAAGRTYRLPTEAEWEYACRAGTTTPFSFGEEMAPIHANCLQVWGETTPVGYFARNPFGLYDMHGQIREWCSDWYGRNYYHHSPMVDPTGPEEERENRVMRGGSWDVSSATYCRSAYRVYFSPDGRLGGIGFRIICEVRG